MVFHVRADRKVIESIRVIESNRWQCNSNRLENLKCNSNSSRLQCDSNSNRQHVIDPIPVYYDVTLS